MKNRNFLVNFVVGFYFIFVGLTFIGGFVAGYPQVKAQDTQMEPSLLEGNIYCMPYNKESGLLVCQVETENYCCLAVKSNDNIEMYCRDCGGPIRDKEEE